MIPSYQDAKTQTEPVNEKNNNISPEIPNTKLERRRLIENILEDKKLKEALEDTYNLY